MYFEFKHRPISKVFATLSAEIIHKLTYLDFVRIYSGMPDVAGLGEIVKEELKLEYSDMDQTQCVMISEIYITKIGEWFK